MAIAKSILFIITHSDLRLFLCLWCSLQERDLTVLASPMSAGKFEAGTFKRVSYDDGLCSDALITLMNRQRLTFSNLPISLRCSHL